MCKTAQLSKRFCAWSSKLPFLSPELPPIHSLPLTGWPLFAQVDIFTCAAFHGSECVSSYSNWQWCPSYLPELSSLQICLNQATCASA